MTTREKKIYLLIFLLLLLNVTLLTEALGVAALAAAGRPNNGNEGTRTRSGRRSRESTSTAEVKEQTASNAKTEGKAEIAKPKSGICATPTLNGPVPCDQPVALAESIRFNSDGSVTSASGIETKSVKEDSTQVNICVTTTTHWRDQKGNIINEEKVRMCGDYPKTMFQRKDKEQPPAPGANLIIPVQGDPTSFGTNGTEIMAARAAAAAAAQNPPQNRRG